MIFYLQFGVCVGCSFQFLSFTNSGHTWRIYFGLFSNNLAPTFEGVSLGILQFSKLLTAIAALIILFGTTTKVQLLSAFSQLLLPFKMLGFNTSRFVVRLLLTLNYVEAFTINEKVNISFDYLNSENLDKVENSPQQVVELPYSPLKLVDKAQVFIIACIFLTLLIPSLSMLISDLSMMKFFSMKIALGLSYDAPTFLGGKVNLMPVVCKMH